MSIDLPEQYEAICYEELSEALLDVRVLAGRVALLATEGADMYTIHHAISRDVVEVADVMHSYEQEVIFTFSGNGFIPAHDYNEEITRTAYARVDNNRGRFSQISLLDSRDFAFIHQDTDEAEESDDEKAEDATALLLDDEETGDLKDNAQLRIPHYGPRLFIEFLTSHQADSEACIGGIAVRSKDTSFYNIMDILLSDISHLELKDASSPVPEAEIVDLMLTEAVKMRGLQRDTAFRRLNRSKQIRSLESTLGTLNRELELSRVAMYVDTKYLYVPVTTEQDRDIKIVALATIADGKLPVKPLRVDSLEAYDLTGGLRITSDRTMWDTEAGLCLVATVDDYFAEKNKLGGSVVWIPLGNKNAKDFIVVPSDQPI